MLTKILEKKLFPQVERPARYIGCEPGAIVKNPADKVNIALAYPDLYEVGMSYTGGQILYHLTNSHDGALCERVYAPAGDAEKILRDEKIPLFSLETHRPLSEFDLLGFTLSYEMVFTNVLNIIDLTQIPLLAADRENHHPLVAAGGPICHNPEPMADFIDFFFIGEVEDSLGDIIAAIKSGKGENREKRLLNLAQITGIYVPRFYDAATHRPLRDDIPEQVQAVQVRELKADYYPEKPIVPLTEITHDRIAVEIMRGCPQGCRFCQAGKVYKPLRLRKPNDIKQQINNAVANTGYDEVSLLSLSTSDYPGIERLVSSLSDELEAQQVALSFPSLRPANFTAKLAEGAKRQRKTGLTFAPEVGTDRMRQVVKKNITEQELLNAVEMVFEKGWQLVKLYFMIGLPTETDEDVIGIADLVNKTAEIGRRVKGQHRINITISPFSPKAHTPFQWDRLNTPEEIAAKQNIIKRYVSSRDVTLKFRDPQLSYLEGILGRGDRTMGRVIHEAFKLGARLDGWSEHFDIEIWNKAFENTGIEPANFARDLKINEPLPWDHISGRRSKEAYWKERSQTSLLAHSRANESAPAPAYEKSSDDEAGMYGRRKKRVVVKNNSVAPTRGKIRLQWGKKGLVRFISHLDNNRVFERAIRRSGLPVAYSQGFHPHQKLSFGPPLPLGYSSDSEYLDIQIEDNCTNNDIERLAQALPEGFFVRDFKIIYSKAPAISALLNRAVYTVYGDFQDAAALRDKFSQTLDLESLIARRATKDGYKEVDIRNAIYRLELHQNGSGPEIEMELGLGEHGYARPQEVMETMQLFEPKELAGFHFHRKALQYMDSDGNYLDPLTAIA